MTEDPTKFKKEPVPEEKSGSEEFSGSKTLEAAYKASKIKAGKIDDFVDFASLSMRLLKKTEKLREDDKARWVKEKKALEDAHQKEIIKLQDAHQLQMDRADVDEVTGLLKKDSLMNKLSRLTKGLRYVGPEKRHHTFNVVMVIVLDMNFLKPINDNYGHPAGDRALLTLADRLRKEGVVKAYDPIFRVGGDEFILILPIVDEDADLEKIFGRFKDSVNTDLFMEIGGDKIAITASMGYSVLRKGESKTDEELIQEADAKMYEDKKGKGRT